MSSQLLLEHHNKHHNTIHDECMLISGQSSNHHWHDKKIMYQMPKTNCYRKIMMSMGQMICLSSKLISGFLPLLPQNLGRWQGPTNGTLSFCNAGSVLIILRGGGDT